jgi:Cu(I)/Ag(I) efflux system membrane protein CusA/SilA
VLDQLGVWMTAILVGLVPISGARGIGSELIQRIAVPMVGGMVSPTVLTLLVIPAIYGIVKAGG